MMRSTACLPDKRADFPAELEPANEQNLVNLSELNVTLNFPNSSRSYDATRRAVRFWGMTA